MPKSKRQRKARQKAGRVDTAPPLTETADSRKLRNDSDGVKTHRGAGAGERPRPGTEQLQEEDHNTEILRRRESIRLRDGTMIDARTALRYWDHLSDNLRWREKKKDPGFDALAAVIRGKTKSIPKELADGLSIFLLADGSVKPEVKTVFLACCEDTPQGPVLHELVTKDNLKDRLTIEVKNEAAKERMVNLLGRVIRGEEKGRGGR